MAYLDDKYSIKIDGKGYIISHRDGKHFYQKRKAPEYVSRTSSGDRAYRDSTFWQYWVQVNWRNGAKQLKWDDPGKFYKSSNVNVTQLDELTLSKSLASAGQTTSGVDVNTLASWRSSQSWWNANYGYRKQLTITAPAGQQAPADYPIVVTEDTAALVTASKMRSDRNDLRVVYWNGTSWVDLTRDYASASRTIFALQASIAAAGSDSNYYLYYGYSGESTNKQPTNDAEWNAVYGMFGTTFDANTLAVWHFDNGSGSTVTDRDASYDLSTSSMTWGTDGRISRYGNFSGAGDYASNTSSDFNLGSFTYECLYYTGTGTGGTQMIVNRVTGSDQRQVYFNRRADGKIELGWQGQASADLVGATALSDNTWYWVAASYDGATARLFVNGTQDASKSDAGGVTSQTTATLWLGKKTTGGSDETNGRVAHLRISNAGRSSFPHHLATDPSVSTGSELTTQPPSSNFTAYAGTSAGKIYSWDGNVTWTEAFDTRRIQSFDTTSSGDTDYQIGDLGGTEYARAMGVQLTTEQAKTKVRGVSLYIKKNTGTPGDVTVRIETNNAGVPSGTLADSSATTTITAFTTSSYGWVSVDFPAAFALAASTTYWIVAKTAAASNDNYYMWLADASSPAYSSGNMASSSDGGSTWSAVAGSDAFFRLLGSETAVNCSLVTKVGGTQKMLFGVGSPTGQENGDARVYSYDGSSWTLEKVFNTATESMVLSLAEFNSKIYAGLGPQAKVYEGTSPSSWTLSKSITTPQNPGYVYSLKEYNSRLLASGGSPEFLPTAYYNGFVNVFDTTTWFSLYPFDFTVIKTCEFYDAFLFMGTYHGQVFVYDTASLNPLFNFKEIYNFSVTVQSMKFFDDKLYMGLYPQTGTGDTNSEIWVFERHGMSSAHSASAVTGYKCMEVINNTLLVGTGSNGYVYKIDPNTYATQGWLQSSYFDANLPSVDKLWSQITVKHDPLAAGTSVKIYYKFKESDSWTLLGTSSTTNSESATFSFASGTYSKKISVKTELNTTDNTKTPRVTETIVRYIVYPQRKWQWNIRLMAIKNMKLADGTYESRTATQIRTDIESAQNAYALNTFIDVDGTTYNVLFTDIDHTSWVANLNDTNENEVLITLLEA